MEASCVKWRCEIIKGCLSNLTLEPWQRAVVKHCNKDSSHTVMSHAPQHICPCHLKPMISCMHRVIRPLTKPSKHKCQFLHKGVSDNEFFLGWIQKDRKALNKFKFERCLHVYVLYTIQGAWLLYCQRLLTFLTTEFRELLLDEMCKTLLLGLHADYSVRVILPWSNTVSIAVDLFLMTFFCLFIFHSTQFLNSITVWLWSSLRGKKFQP